MGNLYTMMEYDRHRKEGLRLHERGRYNDAVQSYLAARSYQPHPSLVMLIVSSRLCQGRLREAISEMDSVEDIDAFAYEDDDTRIGLHLTKAWMESLATMTFSRQLEICTEIYQMHLAPRIPNGLTKQQGRTGNKRRYTATILTRIGLPIVLVSQLSRLGSNGRR